jgi:hypothetical protein
MNAAFQHTFNGITAIMVIVLANFSEREQDITVSQLRAQGFAHFARDVFTQEVFSTRDALFLSPMPCSGS